MKKLFVFVPGILVVVFLLKSFAAKVVSNKSGLANTVFKSTDGGQTWQDISKGLPENLRADNIRGIAFLQMIKGFF